MLDTASVVISALCASHARSAARCQGVKRDRLACDVCPAVRRFRPADQAPCRAIARRVQLALLVIADCL